MRSRGSFCGCQFSRGFTSNILGSNDVAELLFHLLGALLHRDKIAFRIPLVDLTRTDNIVYGVLYKLIPVSKPSGQTGKSEHDGKHFVWDSERLVNDA